MTGHEKRLAAGPSETPGWVVFPEYTHLAGLEPARRFMPIEFSADGRHVPIGDDPDTGHIAVAPEFLGWVHAQFPWSK